MIKEYERYHGVAIRELILSSPSQISFSTFQSSGRIHSYLINGRTGLHIKHCAKRLPPWQFTFLDEHVGEIGRMTELCECLWLALICGSDGIVCLSAEEFYQVTLVHDATTRFIRIDRDRHTKYRVFGNAGRLGSAKPRGLAPLIRSAFESGI